jgi:mannose-6-phosphate isomerase-like protein (cupin superfamily)
MEPGSSVKKDEVGNFCVIHFVVEGSPAVSTASESSDLMPGDSVVLNVGEDYTIANRAFARATLLSIVFKNGEVPMQETKENPV